MPNEKTTTSAPMKTRTGRKPSMSRYSTEMRWLKNKERKIKRHLKKYPNDLQAAAALARQ